MTTTLAPTAHPAVDDLLAAIGGGRGGDVAGCYADDVVVDLTVPNWRFTRRGSQAIAAEYAGWFADLARFEELQRIPTPTGEVVTYLLAWDEAGVPHAAHHCHVLQLDPTTGRIVRETVFCGGRWDAALLAEMAAADHAG